MALTLQFVDAISATPVVLLDLNDMSPLYVAANSWAPPPQLQRAESSSSSRDGAVVAQSSYMDREITVTVGIKSSSQDEAASAIQALARLLNSDGQWLLFNPGTTNPVFFRTKRAEIDALAEFNGRTDGMRLATLTIPAEPFAYGLPESGSFTVNNDPSGPKVAATAINLASNPSFETSNGGTVSVPAGGTAPDVQRQGGGGVTDTGGNARVYQSTTWASEVGKFSMCVDAGQASATVNTAALVGGAISGSSARLGFVTGRTYKVSATIRLIAAQTGTVNSRSRKIVVVQDVSSVQTDLASSAAAPNAAGTTRVSVTFTAPTIGGSTEVFLRLFNGEQGSSGGGGGGKVWWDDLLIEDVTTAAELDGYYDGDSFGWGWTGTRDASTSGIATEFPVAVDFPGPVKGDVASPLWLSWATPDADRWMIGSSAIAPAADVINQLRVNATALPSATAGYSIADSADANSVGGIKRLVTHTSGTATQTVMGLTTHEIEPGDYRVLVRCAPSGGVWDITLEIYGGEDDPVVVSRSYATTSAAAQWVDLGVQRLPTSYPIATDLYDGPAIDALMQLSTKSDTNATTAKFDDILFVPAGVDSAADTRLAVADVIGDAVIDGASGVAYWWSVPIGGVANVPLPGGFPRVLPGCDNTMTWVVGLNGAVSPFYASENVLTGSTDVDWSYYPRYLYIRPATT